MKTIISLIALIAFSGCQTTIDPSTGRASKSLTPAAKQELVAVGNVTAQIIANGIAIGATNSAAQWIATGRVDSKVLAQAEMYGVASNAQAYIGQLVPRSVIVDSAGAPAVQAALADSLPPSVKVTQSTVDALQAAAAANVSPKS